MELLKRDHGITGIEAEARVDPAERKMHPVERFLKSEDARARRADAKTGVEDDLSETEAVRDVAWRYGRRECNPVFGHSSGTKADLGAAGIFALGYEASAPPDLDMDWPSRRRPHAQDELQGTADHPCAEKGRRQRRPHSHGDCVRDHGAESGFVGTWSFDRDPDPEAAVLRCATPGRAPTVARVESHPHSAPGGNELPVEAEMSIEADDRPPSQRQPERAHLQRRGRGLARGVRAGHASSEGACAVDVLGGRAGCDGAVAEVPAVRSGVARGGKNDSQGSCAGGNRG